MQNTGLRASHVSHHLVLATADEAGGFPGGTVVKNPPPNAGDTGDVGSISGLERSPERGNGITLQHSCLENPMDRGAWWASPLGHSQTH